MFIAQTPASALVFNHSSELCILVYVIYDLVINDKQNPKPDFLKTLSCLLLVSAEGTSTTTN